MASHVFVLDSSFKRTQVKVTPGKYLREVLEEACKARKLNPESYALKTQTNKVLDLSQPFRLSGLSAGAKLQLTQASRSPSVVNVGLQLPDSEGGGRLSDKFPSTTSLWLMLRKFEDAVAGQTIQKINLTQRGVPQLVDSGAGRLEYEQPCVNLMGRSLETFADLQKSLAQLGVNSGNVLIRLTFKKTGQPLEEAMKEIDQYFSSLETGPAHIGGGIRQDTRSVHALPDGEMQSLPDVAMENAAIPAEGAESSEPDMQDDIALAQSNAQTAQPISEDVIATTSSETESVPASQPSNVVNGISVFRPPSSSTPAAALQQEDGTMFEPSLDHAKSHQAALQRAGRNQKLLSEKELEEQEAERQSKLALVQTVTVRVRYPDQSMIETIIHASETPADLYAKVMGTLACAPEPFELRFTGNKGHQTLPNSFSQRLVRDFGFRGRVLVTMLWSPDASAKARQGPSLKDEYRSKAQDLQVELATQQAEAEQSHKAAMAKSEQKQGATGDGKGKGDLEAKMKKFLGFGKK